MPGVLSRARTTATNDSQTSILILGFNLVLTICHPYSGVLSRLKSLKRHWSVYLIAGLYLYLAVHAVSGNQGLMRWVDYQEDIAIHKRKLSALQTQRAVLETQALNLNADHLNLDVLDMKSREKLFISDPNDLTIFLDQTP